MATQTDALTEIWADIEDELAGHIGQPSEFDRRGRARARVMYDTTQRLTLWNGNDVPDDEQFQPVRLINVSGSGIAFWSNERLPAKQQLVLQLDVDGHRRMVALEVIRCMGVVTDEGGFAYQIGCRHKAILLR